MSTSKHKALPQTSFTEAEPPRPYAFVTTHWTVVVAAGRSDTAQAHAALEKLCQSYWFPLYAYVRRRGYSVEDAQDLTQEFFARVLEHQWLARAEQAKGRFRTFLLTAMERFLANEWDKARRLKRGGGRACVSLQIDTAETRYGVEPADDRTPEQAFENRWALTLLEGVMERLEAEFCAEGQAELFVALKPCLVGDCAAQPYVELAAALGMNEGAVKVAVHRLRQRYRELLRAEIANTVASPADVDAEMRHLFNVLAKNNGGFMQFFYNSSNEDASPNEYVAILPSSLARIGCPVASKIAADAIACLKIKGDVTPTTIDAALGQLNDEEDDDISERMDERFYQNKEEIANKLFEYIKAKKGAIVLK